MKAKTFLMFFLFVLTIGFLYSNELLNEKIEKNIAFIEYISEKQIYFGLSGKFNDLVKNHYEPILNEIKSDSLAVLTESDKDILLKFINLVQTPNKKHLEWAMDQIDGDYLSAFGYLTYIKKLAENISKDSVVVRNFNYLIFMMEPLTGHVISEYPFDELDLVFSDAIDIVLPELSPKEFLLIAFFLSRTWGGIDFKTVIPNVEKYIEKNTAVLKSEEIKLLSKIKDRKELDESDLEIIERLEL